MRIGQNTAPEGFVLFAPFGEIGEIVCAPQSELDAAALRADGPEITLLSVATLIATECPYEALPWPIVSSRGEGPLLAAREPIALDKLGGRKTATPGATMTETLLAATLLPTYDEVQRTDCIADSIVSGDIEAGILCDQTQCDLERLGLVPLEDIGARFAKYQSGLPVPLRVVAMRSELSTETRSQVERGLQHAMDRFEKERSEVIAECAKAVHSSSAAVDAYLSRTLDPDARLDAPDFRAALEVLREYNDADYYAANGRF